MGCCSTYAVHHSQKEKVFCEPTTQNSQNPHQPQEQAIQPKDQEQTMEKVTCENQIAKKNNLNHLITLKENQYIVYNKDDLNAVEDQFFIDNDQQKPQQVEKANSDDDY